MCPAHPTVRLRWGACDVCDPTGVQLRRAHAWLHVAATIQVSARTPCVESVAHALSAAWSALWLTTRAMTLVDRADDPPRTGCLTEAVRHLCGALRYELLRRGVPDADAEDGA
jgi:hypothetical protein